MVLFGHERGDQALLVAFSHDKCTLGLMTGDNMQLFMTPVFFVAACMAQRGRRELRLAGVAIIATGSIEFDQREGLLDH